MKLKYLQLLLFTLELSDTLKTFKTFLNFIIKLF
jgi:hypothetical protein